MEHDPILFQRVREGVDIVEAARYYGLEPDRRGWCLCPFHGEKTPSFHLYQQKFRCFGCNASGDVVDLVSALLEVKPLEAVKELNEAFHLGIDLNAPADPTALARAEAERERRRRFQAWRKDALLMLTRRFRYLWLTVKAGGALAVPGGLSDAYAAALGEIETVGYYLDLLTFEGEDTIQNARAVIDEAVARVKEVQHDVG